MEFPQVVFDPLNIVKELIDVLKKVSKHCGGKTIGVAGDDCAYWKRRCFVWASSELNAVFGFHVLEILIVS